MKSFPSLKKFLGAAISLSLRTAIVFLLLEGILRLAGVSPDISLTNPEGPFIVDSNLKWRFKPHYRGKWSGVPFETNRWGLRDDEFPLEKPPGETRVLVLGGSITTGYAIKRPLLYIDQLEEAFQKRQGEKPITFINAGIPGYTTSQNLYYLRKEGLSFKPDGIILDFSLRSVTDQYAHSENTGEFRGGGAFFRFGGTHGRKASFSMPVFLRDLPRYSALYTAVRWFKVKILAKKLGKKESDRQRLLMQELFKYPTSPRMEKAWKNTEREVLKILQITRTKNIPFILLNFPLRQEMDPKTGLDHPQKRMENFCHQHQIPFIPLLAPFRKKFLEGTPVDLLFLDEGHPSMKGHHLAANVIYQKWPHLFQQGTP